jgi:uncharacterized protein YecE (DUF72 family)
MNWHIGCSGFHYKEWKGKFYPENMRSRQWFEYYSSQFSTLELNVTFYRFPQISFLDNWYEKSPDNFTFSIKVPRLITHYKKFTETRQLLDDFYVTARKGLRDKLGPVLFQLPPQYEYTQERLEQILQSLNPSFNNVIEFRHKSWWERDILEEFTRHQVTFCGINYPGLPKDVIINTSSVYYRFHGVPHLYHSAYTDKQLEEVAEVIQKSRKAEQAWIYFNNTASVAAVENALFLEKVAIDK